MHYGAEVWGIMADHRTIERVRLFASNVSICLMLVQEHLVHWFMEKLGDTRFM